ncbi:MAG: S1 RNA-binding domain-containing protein [Bacilli bacterium]|nr:S1 RNA-binding domain-containing protein [Bacilli bacterium]
MAKDKYQIGNIVTGCVTGIEKYGIFVGLDNYYSGLIHISEISDSFVRNIRDYVTIGETIKVKILDFNSNDFHVKLSIKGIDYRINRRKRTKIIETSNGFSSLKKKLDFWMKNKTEEILNKQGKKM